MNILDLFNKGTNWAGFVSEEKLHGNEMEKNLKNIMVDDGHCRQVVEESVEYFICFGEGWCPDTSQQFSLIEKISRATGTKVCYFHSDSAKAEIAQFNEEGASNYIPLIIMANENGEIIHSIRGRAPIASKWSNDFKAGRDPSEISKEEWLLGRAQFMELYCNELFKETLGALTNGKIGLASIEEGVA